MNGYKQKTNWVLDLLLLLLFLFLFFLDISGVVLHQWLGILFTGLIILHLFNHSEWINCMLSRFFGKTSKRARLYAVIDALLLLGLVMIVESGLVISTWFNFTWIDYATWREIHIYSSIAALVLTVVKIGIHRGWIINTTKKLFVRRTASSVPAVTSGAATVVSRRQFLAAMGLISLGSALVISRVLPGNRYPKDAAKIAAEEEAQGVQATEVAQSEPAATQAETAQSAPVTTNAPVEGVPATATEMPLPQATPTSAAADSSQSALVCTRGCRKGKHCTYPGSCHDYTDQNGNGLCDLGECA